MACHSCRPKPPPAEACSEMSMLRRLRAEVLVPHVQLINIRQKRLRKQPLRFAAARMRRTAEICSRIFLRLSAGCSRGAVWATIRSPFSCPVFLAWGLSSLCALFPPGEPELLPAPSPSSPNRIPLRITLPYPAPSIPLKLLLNATNRKTIRTTSRLAKVNTVHIDAQTLGARTTGGRRPIVATIARVYQSAAIVVATSCHWKP